LIFLIRAPPLAHTANFGRPRTAGARPSRDRLFMKRAIHGFPRNIRVLYTISEKNHGGHVGSIERGFLRKTPNKTSLLPTAAKKNEEGSQNGSQNVFFLLGQRAPSEMRRGRSCPFQRKTSNQKCTRNRLVNRSK